MFSLHKEPTTAGDPEEAKEMPAVPVPPTRAPAPALLSKQEEAGELEEMIGAVSLFNRRFILVDLDEKYPKLATPTGYFSDGRKRIVHDFLVQSTHKDNFRVTMSNTTCFLLQTRLPAIFLDAMSRAQHKFDPNHRDTYVLVAGMRATIDDLVDWYGSNFETVWSSGTTHQLPFKCNPNPNVQLFWHSGCIKLLTNKTHERGAPDAVHQQMPILRMTFTLQEIQRMAGVSLDDIVIHTMPTWNVMGAGSAPAPQPPQPGAFSGVGGGGGFGSGGFGGGGGSGDGGGGGGGGGGGRGGISGGGGFSGHGRMGRKRNAPPADGFGVLHGTTALATLNAVHQPHIRSGLYAESQRCQTRICSRQQREKMDADAAAARKLAPRVEEVESEEEGESIKEMLCLEDKDFGQSLLSL